MSSEPRELDDLEADAPADVKGGGVGVPTPARFADAATAEAREDVADVRDTAGDRVDTAADKLGLHTGP